MTTEAANTKEKSRSCNAEALTRTLDKNRTYHIAYLNCYSSPPQESLLKTLQLTTLVNLRWLQLAFVIYAVSYFLAPHNSLNGHCLDRCITTTHKFFHLFLV